MSKDLLFEKTEWDAAMPRVAADMSDYLKAYRAPVFEDLGSHGVGWGSASYLQLGSRVFLLTNEHVARAREEGRRLIYQFAGQDDLRLVVGDYAKFGVPVDLALMAVDAEAWADSSNQSRAIKVDQIALSHFPVPMEVLSFVGYAGESVSFHFSTVISTATCSTAREVDLPQDDPRFQSRFHFGLDYKPGLATDVISTRGLPLPPGLSGSTVWNTRFVEAKAAGRQWTPEMANVTGVVWGWPSNVGCLVATRAEYLRSFLLSAVQQLGTGV